MKRQGIIGPLLGVGIGMALAYVLSGGPSRPVETATLLEDSRASVSDHRDGTERRITELARQVATLTGKLAVEAAERRRLEERLESFTTELAALGDSKVQVALTAKAGPTPADIQPTRPNAPEPAPGNTSATTTMERALLAAGTDAATAADIKQRNDDLALAAMYLRDRATREHWADTPRFEEEMAAIEGQRTSIREEIGDDGYDRYLAALGEPNRVRVEDVMTESSAARVGLQQGDVVLRYGDARIFTPGDLVNATRGGTAGEMTQVEILRQGQVLDVEVPRGPLGLRIAASQAVPDGG
jgi:hypothetical protein